MSDKRAPRRSLDDWMELVTECRQSGLTDAAWCEAQGISPSCFYNAVSRLRKRACQIPDPIGKASTLDLTSHKQDVVQIAIEPELSPAELFQDERSSSMYLDNSHTIEIEAKGLTIRMSNTVQPMLLKILMDCKVASTIRARFAQVTQNPLCVFSLLGNLDGDSASPFPRFLTQQAVFFGFYIEYSRSVMVPITRKDKTWQDQKSKRN